MVESYKPDLTAQAVRFGCGALMGSVIGIGIAAQLMGLDAARLPFIMVCVAGTLIGGYAAMKAGNEFWHWLAEHWRWF